MLLSVLVAFLLSACGKYRGYDKVKEAKPIKGICFELEEGTHIINSDAELDAVLEGQDCPQLYIDFNTHTLLGFYTEGSGCDIDFSPTLYVNEDDQTYHYVVKVKERGHCAKLAMTMNWMSVPKIPADYAVEFVKD